MKKQSIAANTLRGKKGVTEMTERTLTYPILDPDKVYKEASSFWHLAECYLRERQLHEAWGVLDAAWLALKQKFTDNLYDGDARDQALQECSGTIAAFALKASPIPMENFIPTGCLGILDEREHFREEGEWLLSENRAWVRAQLERNPDIPLLELDFSPSWRSDAA